jgi:hypothetical protein
MGFILRALSFILISATFAFSQAAGSASAETTQNANNAASERAASFLEKMGVPLERDPQGQIRWIRASQGELNDIAMQYLPDLRKLEWLEIGSGDVSSTGLAHLGNCTSIRRLFIHDIALQDNDLKFLSKLLHVEALSLQRTGITGRVLQYLKMGNTLTILNLSGDVIADEDLDAVSKFSRLEVLALQDTKITGSGLAKLEGMPRLNVLNLSNCQITDSDALLFTTLPNLRIAHAAGCNLSESVIRDLQMKVPMLAVFR